MKKLLLIFVITMLFCAVAVAADYKVGDTFNLPEKYSGEVSTSYKSGVVNKQLFTVKDFQGVKKIMDIKAGKYSFWPYAQNRVNPILLCVNKKGVVVAAGSTCYEIGGFELSYPVGSFGFDCFEDGAVYLISDQPFSAKMFWK